MDENLTGAPRDPDPFRDLLRRDGPWAPAGGVRLTHRQTGEAFGLLAVADPEEAPRWSELVEALAGVETERLVVPRAVIDDGTAVLYSDPDELGESFASLLEDPGALEQAETMRMSADLAAALQELHSCGAVLGRLRLQDVLRTVDGGWALLLSPASGAHAAEGPELEERSRADVVLLASAAVTVLTGRRPSAARSRPPLRSTHPLLDPGAADALDLVLERAGQQEGVDRGGAGQRHGPGMLTASELAQLLQPESESMEGSASVGAGSESTAATGPGAVVEDVAREGCAVRAQEPEPGAFGPLSADDDVAFQHDEEPVQSARLLALRTVSPGESQLPQRSARSLRASALKGSGRARSGEGHARSSAAGPEDPRRPRRVLAGAAAIVLAASALTGWQILSGTDDDSPSAVGSSGQSAGAADAQEAVTGEESATEQAAAEPAASATEAAAGSSTATQAAAGDQPPAEGDAVSAQLSPEYASAALIAQRADALRTGDRDLLASVYAPEAADLADDLETLEQARSEGAFTDLQMALADAVPLASGSTGEGAEPGGGQRTASVTGTVEASGTGLDPARDGATTLRQDVAIELVAERGAWRILDVTPR